MNLKPPPKIVMWPLLMASIGLIAIFEPRVVLSKTESIKYRVLFLTDGIPGKGDYISIAIRHPLLDPVKPVKLVKRIVCIGGERLIYSEGTHFCGHQPLGHVLAHTSRGLPLTPFVWRGVIPPGKVFIMGDHVRSLDSRYFGFVDLAQARKVWPLF